MTNKEHLKQLESELAIIKKDYDQKADPIKSKIAELQEKIRSEVTGLMVGDKVMWNRASWKKGTQSIIGVVRSIESEWGITVHPLNKDGTISKNHQWLGVKSVTKISQ